MAKRKKKLPVPSGEMLDFVVMLHRIETDTKIRWIEQFNPFNEATGQLYTQEEFRKELNPYADNIRKEYPNFDVYIYLASNEDIEELQSI